jgi:lysophospholipase L1-like esterase
MLTGPVMFKQIIIGSSAAILILVIISVLSYKYIERTVQEKPGNNPSQFIKTGKTKPGNKVIVCVGDSITHGTVSSNYVDILSERLRGKGYDLVNAGINSELAYNVLQRIDDIVKCDPDYVTILIGTNDASASISESNAKRYIREMSLPQAPTLEWYRKNLVRVCDTLKKKSRAKIALLSLPPIGEDPDSMAYRRSDLYSRTVMEVAAMKGIAYLPLHEKMSGYIKKNKKGASLPYVNGFSFNNHEFVMYKAIFEMFVLRKSLDDIARGNNFLIVSDLLHLNSRGGAMVADMIEEFVKK